MPRYINFMWLHYNKEFLDEAGVDYPDINWTVDDLADAALRATKKKADGTVEVYGMNYPSWVMERMFYHLERFGGAFVLHDDPKNCLMDTPESQEALEWLRKRYWEDYSYAEPLLTNRSWGTEVFRNEYCAMAEGGGPEYFLRDASQLFDCDFMHPPIGPVKRSSYLVTDGYGMWSGGQFQDAAWEVMKYLSDDINQDIRQRVTGQTATRTAVVARWPEQVSELVPTMADMNLQVVLDAYEMAYGTDDERFFCQSEAEEIINPLLEKVYIIGDSPASILGDACAEVEAAQTCEAI
jgi:ABC-type glycerol-3-phosphate transport system substrate-binding protein